MILETPILVSTAPALQMVNVRFKIPDVFNRKVAFKIPKSGDLVPSLNIGWKQLSWEEAFKNTCWNFLSMCNRYLQHVSISCEFTTDSFIARISANRFTRGGFKDELTIQVERGHDSFHLWRKSTRRGGKVKEEFKEPKINFYSFQYFLERCLKKWEQNSQFQFAIY